MFCNCFSNFCFSFCLLQKQLWCVCLCESRRGPVRNGWVCVCVSVYGRGQSTTTGVCVCVSEESHFEFSFSTVFQDARIQQLQQVSFDLEVKKRAILLRNSVLSVTECPCTTREYFQCCVKCDCVLCPAGGIVVSPQGCPPSCKASGPSNSSPEPGSAVLARPNWG